MNRANTITWIILMIMTVVNFAMGERHVAAWMILAIAGVKFSLVAWQFMELRRVKAGVAAARQKLKVATLQDGKVVLK